VNAWWSLRQPWLSRAKLCSWCPLLCSPFGHFSNFSMAIFQGTVKCPYYGGIMTSLSEQVHRHMRLLFPLRHSPRTPRTPLPTPASLVLPLIPCCCVCLAFPCAPGAFRELVSSDEVPFLVCMLPTPPTSCPCCGCLACRAITE
jgi:hypothetical protein